MFQKNTFFLIVLVTQYGNTTKGSAERVQDAPGVKVGWEGHELKNYNFPEFDKIATFLQPLVKQVENDKCRKQLQNYVKSLKNSSLWAVQMFDASAKVPQGLLTSDAYDLGNYDGCVEINLRRAEEDNIFGKYCLARVTLVKNGFNLSHLRQSGDVFMEQEISTWEKLMVPVFKYGFINDLFRPAICVPNQCTSQDVENILRYLYNNATKMIKRKTQVWVSENSCSTKETGEYQTVNLITRGILGLILWITISTIFELLGWFCNSKVGWIRILMTFSAYKNFKIFTAIKNPQHIPVLNSLKVYTFIIFVITRRLSFFIMGPIVNRRTVDQVFTRSFRENFFDMGNDFIGDTFLVLEGFFQFYKVHSYFRNNPNISIWRVYLLEYLKTIPLYALAILFYGYILETVGSGPMWKERTGSCITNCQQNWVVNLLYLNNLSTKNKMCIFESWYFAVIAQCFVSIPIVVQVMIKSSTTGLTILGLLTATTFVLPMAVPYYGLDLRSTLENESSDIQLHKRIDTGTIHRALPYFIGVCSSALYTKVFERRKTFSRAHSKAFSFLTIAFCGLTMSTCFSLIFKKPKTVQWALVNTLRQLIWSFTVSGIILGVSTKTLPWLTPIFNQKYIFLLGRLSYSCLLVLGMIQLYTTGIIRTLDYLSPSRLIWMSTADLLATWIFSFIFYMTVHRPASNILHEKLLQGHISKSTKQSKKKHK